MFCTPEQVLVGLRDIFEEDGFDPWFTLDTRIDTYLKHQGEWADFDLADLCSMTEEHFGFHATREEWGDFFGSGWEDAMDWEERFGRRFTFESLAEFIRQRIDVDTIEPWSCFGQPCLSAGVFKHLERIARAIRPTVHRFGPKTAIWSRLRGQALRSFWGRLRWMTGGALPPLEVTRGRQMYNRGAFVLSFCIAFPLAYYLLDFVVNEQNAILTVILTALWGSMLFIAVRVAFCTIGEYVFNPIPAHLRTFRDVAVFWAGSLSSESNQSWTLGAGGTSPSTC